MDIEVIVVSVVISLVLNGFIAVLFKSAIEAVFNRELFEIKKESTKELTILNSELQRLNDIESSRLIEINQKRAVAIFDMYRELVKAEQILTDVVTTGRTLPKFRSKEESEEEIIKKYSNVVNTVSDLTQLYRENKIFLTKKQIDLLDVMLEKFNSLQASSFFDDLFKATDNIEYEDTRKFGQDWFKRVFAEYVEIYPSLKEGLEFEFRKILGIEISEELMGIKD